MNNTTEDVDRPHPLKGELSEYAPCGMCPVGLCDNCFECMTIE